MAMIKKQVTGSAEAMKSVKNAKNASKTAMGGTQRTSFEGSRDPRKSGNPGPNTVLKTSGGYVDQAAVTMGDTSHSRSFTKRGMRGSTAGNITTVAEDVTRGMGGRVIKDMK